jgi:hypothetical protein
MHATKQHLSAPLATQLAAPFQPPAGINKLKHSVIYQSSSEARQQKASRQPADWHTPSPDNSSSARQNTVSNLALALFNPSILSGTIIQGGTARDGAGPIASLELGQLVCAAAKLAIIAQHSLQFTLAANCQHHLQIPPLVAGKANSPLLACQV